MIETALYAQLIVFLAVVVAFGFSRSASLFHPLTFYLLFHFIVFVLRPMMVYYLHFEGRWIYMGFRPSPDQFIFTLFVTSMAMLIFAAVCWPMAKADIDFTKVNFIEFTPAQTKAIVWTWLLLGPWAIYSAIYASQVVDYDGISADDTSGGIQMTFDMTSGITIYLNTTGYLTDAQTMLGPLSIMLMWRNRFVLWSWIPLVFFILYRAFLGGGRWPMITMIFTLVLLQLLRDRKKWFKIKFFAVFLPIFMLFQSIGLDRNLLRDAITGTQTEIPKFKDERTWLQKQDNPDFANFEFLAFILAVVPEKSRTYTYFTQYLQLFTEPVPRILWRDKPVGMPIKMINLNNFGNFIGLTNSIVGDGWMSGGWIGLVLTMTIVAGVLGIYHRRFWQRPDNPSSVMLYCTFLPLTIQWFRDGGISIAKFILFTFLPILVWQFFTRVIEDSSKPVTPFTRASR
jgi:hypothetical protein